MAALKRALALAATTAAVAAATAHAAVIHYVQSAPSGDCAAAEACTAIGLPVPAPQNSQTPVAGFRAYDSLIAGLQDLAMQNADVAAFQSAGKTAYGRDIWAFRLGTAGALTAGGLPAPAFLHTGGIHAREWVAPELVAGYMEALLGSRADHGLHQFLLENVQTVLVPVLNVDGFLQTQRFPAQAQQSDCAEDGSPVVPRDGRMRRKNLDADGTRVDEDLFTAGDATLGVDANRNNLPWWGGVPGSSGTPCSLIYRGTAAQSEKEVQALLAAAALAPANRLRLYIDAHSYKRAYLSADTLNARRNALQSRLANLMRAVGGNRYCYSQDQGDDCTGSPSPAGNGIGSTDEFFANTYQIPAYTLEAEPRGGSGISDYPGGVNVSNSGFILPAAELARVRSELTAATVLGVYHQAGPPSIAAVAVTPAQGGAPVFSAQWQPAGATARSLSIGARQALQPGASYGVWIAFDKPMRVRAANGAVAQYAGQSVALAPALALEGVAADGSRFTIAIATGADGWRNAAGGAPGGYLRYADDAYLATVQIPADAPLAGARRLSLAVSASDFSGQALDANPATAADWSGGAWSRYEDGDCTEGDAGGTDRSIRIVDDGAPLCSAASGGGGSGGGGIGTLAIAALFGAAVLRRKSRR